MPKWTLTWTWTLKTTLGLHVARRSPASAVMGWPAAALALLLGGCPSEPPGPAVKPCCEQPPIPSGVRPFTVVADESTGPSDGQKVALRVAVGTPIRRDEVYPVLHTVYRHAVKRTAFEPIQLVVDVYGSEADARAGGDAKSLARLTRGQGDIAPRCDIRVKHAFSEQTSRAFAFSLGRGIEEDLNDTCHLAAQKASARHDDAYKHKPSFKVIEERKAVAVSYPYLQLDKDEYVETLTMSSALTYWIELLTSMFRKVDDLQEVSYAGIWNDAPVVNITVSRRQFDAYFSSLQEEISAHGGVTFQSLGTGRMNDQQALKEQEAFKAKTYKAALARLPKGQVTLSPKLK